jgi:hypothetical protein
MDAHPKIDARIKTNPEIEHQNEQHGAGSNSANFHN